jgi:hypothetical protein
MMDQDDGENYKEATTLQGKRHRYSAGDHLRRHDREIGLRTYICRQVI